MASRHRLLVILVSLFVNLFSLVCAAQTPSPGKHVHLLQNETKILRKADMEVVEFMNIVSPETPKTTDSISQKPHNNPPFPHHHQRHLQNVQLIMRFMGWNTLIVIGVIVARYLRRFPMQCEEWYTVHTMCQTVGYLVGTVGFCISLLLATSSKSKHYYYSPKPQRILTIIAFTLLTLQMVSICVRTRKEGYIKWWRILHKIVGYAIVAIVIAISILEGINYQTESGGILNLVSVAIVGLLLLIAFCLEISRFIKSTRILIL